MSVRYSVVVPVLNGDQAISGCIQALLAQQADAPFEVIIVDDGSTDRTVEVASAFPVRVLVQSHAGPAAARNRGALAATGEFLLFTDADCEPAPDWIMTLTRPLREDAAVAGARGIHRTRRRELIARFAQAEYEVKFSRLASADAIDFMDTNCCVYRRQVFLDQGGFDTSFRAASNEDTEFGFKLARQGFRLVFVPDAIVYHDHADSLERYLARKVRHGYWRINVYSRYPERMAGDSYTPRSLQVQFVTAWLTLAGGLVGWIHPALAWLAAAALGTFLLACLPFARAGWRQGPEVAAVSFPVLFLRSLALGTGLGAGLAARLLRLDRAAPAGTPEPERQRGD